MIAIAVQLGIEQGRRITKQKLKAHTNMLESSVGFMNSAVERILEECS